MLEIQASLLNRDIGFVEVGQPAEVKFVAFPFTRYGLIEGQVVSLSADAVVDERLGPVYPMKVRLDEERIRVGDRWVGLSPGMTVTGGSQDRKAPRDRVLPLAAPPVP